MLKKNNYKTVLAALMLMIGSATYAQSAKQATAKTSEGKELSYSYALQSGKGGAITVNLPEATVKAMAKGESMTITLPTPPGFVYDYSTVKKSAGIEESPVAGILVLNDSNAASFSINTKETRKLINSIGLILIKK